MLDVAAPAGDHYRCKSQAWADANRQQCWHPETASLRGIRTIDMPHCCTVAAGAGAPGEVAADAVADAAAWVTNLGCSWDCPSIVNCCPPRMSSSDSCFDVLLGSSVEPQLQARHEPHEPPCVVSSLGRLYKYFHRCADQVSICVKWPSK